MLTEVEAVSAESNSFLESLSISNNTETLLNKTNASLNSWMHRNFDFSVWGKFTNGPSFS